MKEPTIDRRTTLYWLLMMPAAAVAGVLGGRADVALAQCRPTGADLQGPFYISGVPHRKAIAPPDEPGTRLIIRGQVLGPDCAAPRADTVLDVWQADASGNYHDDRLRGRLTTDARGRYELYSILPGQYRIGGRFRPAHIHFTITRPGHAPLTTQLYFRGDPYLAANDACGPMCRSDDPGRIIALRKDEKIGAEFLTGVFDIVLAPA
jgi:catechol 1,2-dioxygenase